MAFFNKTKYSLASSQVDRLSNIFDNAGQIILGISVLSPIISGLEKISVPVILSGVIGTISCWILSLLFARRVEEL